MYIGEERENELALKTAEDLLHKRPYVQAWHIPDWISDQNEHTEQPDDLQIISFFDEELEKLQKILSSSKTIEEPPMTKEEVLRPFKEVGAEDLFDPDEYNPENYPWYRADNDDDVHSYDIDISSMLESIRPAITSRQRT